MRGLLLPSANQFHSGHNFFSPSHNLRVYDYELLFPLKFSLEIFVYVLDLYEFMLFFTDYGFAGGDPKSTSKLSNQSNQHP